MIDPLLPQPMTPQQIADLVRRVKINAKEANNRRPVNFRRRDK
jgi:hypothetical protein